MLSRGAFRGHRHRWVGTSCLRRSNTTSLLQRYKDEVYSGRLLYDEHQYRVSKYLSRLSDHLNSDNYTPTIIKPLLTPEEEIERHNKAKKDASTEKADGSNMKEKKEETLSNPPRIVKGLYIYDKVGTGKTMLMDLFYSSVTVSQKRRVHFHQFMLEIHKRIRDYKQELLALYGRDTHIDLSSERDAIAQVALAVSKESWVLCFDEFQVTDIADALILSKFFDILYNHGTVVVATSNRQPSDLYKNGLNRNYFLPFLERLEKQSIVLHMNGDQDYRSKTTPLPETSFVSQDKASRSFALYRKFLSIGNDVQLSDVLLQYDAQGNMQYPESVNGQYFHVPVSSIVPIMMGRTLLAEYSFPRTLAPDMRGKYVVDEVNEFEVPRLSLHADDRIISTWPTDSDSTNNSSQNPIELTEEDATLSSMNAAKTGYIQGSSRGVAWFSFKFLCSMDRGASDYQSICNKFETVFIDNIPQLSVLQHDQARRFITLIDTLYDSHVRLYWSSQHSIENLFVYVGESDFDGAGGEGLFGTDHQWASSDYKIDTESRNPDGGGNAGNGDDGYAYVPKHKRSAEQRAATLRFSTHSRKSPSDSCIFDYQTFAASTQTNISDKVGNESNDNDDDGNNYKQDMVLGVDAAQEELKVLEGELSSVQELSFAFMRAASRIREMAGQSYQDRWIKKGAW